MSNRMDDKLSALQTLLSISGGNIKDLERAWLVTEVTDYGNPNDMWLQVFQANGATSDEYNTAAYEFLTDLGYTGSYADMWAQYWADGGGLTRPDNVVSGVDNVVSGIYNVVRA